MIGISKETDLNILYEEVNCTEPFPSVRVPGLSQEVFVNPDTVFFRNGASKSSFVVAVLSCF
jgi:hypothetical protein